MLSRWLICLAVAVEDFRPGYPQFSALIASHPSFHVCRRFLRIRARLLLLKQDELSLLESQLDNIDNEETRELFLGNRRRDANTERKDIVGKIEVALASYGVSLSPLPKKIEALTLMLFFFLINVDAILDRNRRIFAFDDPRETDITNIQNWVENTSSLAQDETAYLLEPKDLMTIYSPQDAASARLTPLLEGVMRTLYKLFRKVNGPQVTLISKHSLQIRTDHFISTYSASKRRFSRSKHFSLLELSTPKAGSSHHGLRRRHSPVGTHCRSQRAGQHCITYGGYRNRFGSSHHSSVDLHQRQDCRGLSLWCHVSPHPPFCCSRLFLFCCFCAPRLARFVFLFFLITA